eukprot:scaffold27730_cov42-Prasinocladus_malaysianus.AAC.2
MRTYQPLVCPPCFADVNPELMRGMQEVLEWVRKGSIACRPSPPAAASADQEGPARRSGAPEHLAAEALEKMKTLLAEAERGRSAAETEARLASGETLALRARLRALEGTFRALGPLGGKLAPRPPGKSSPGL